MKDLLLQMNQTKAVRINKKKAKIMPVVVVKKSLHQSPKAFLRTRIKNNNSNNYNSNNN